MNVSLGRKILFVVFISAFLGLSSWLIWIESNRIVPIVMYHHIDDRVHQTHTVSPQVFEEQLIYLKDHGFKVLKYEELVEGIKSGKKHDRKTVVLTFDDGYEDNYTQALPLLQKYGMTAMFFVPSDHIGEKGHVSWEQLKEMAAAGMEIGSHTRRHAYLPEKSTIEQRDEIINSKKYLEYFLQQPVHHFSFPVGGFNEKIKSIVQRAGYHSAVSTNRGYDRYNKDIYELNRVTIDDEDNFGPIRWAKFSGYYNLFRKARNPD